MTTLLEAEAQTPVQRSFISLTEMERIYRENPISYIIEGLLPADDVHVAVGDSGLGKTPWAYQLGLCVATGVPFLGYPTHAGRVLYYDLENGAEAVLGLGRALCEHLGVQPFPDQFFVRNEDVSVPRLDQAVAEYRPSLVIVDTLRAFKPQAESANDEMGKFLNENRSLARSQHCAILMLHHVRKPSREKAVPDLQDTSVLEWLHEAAGARALINQTNTRIALDVQRGIDQPGAALLMKSFVKMKGETGLAYLERVCDADGEPVGYRRKIGAQLLANQSQEDAYSRLPKRFRFKEAVTIYGKSDDPTRKWLIKCLGVGILEQPARGVYVKPELDREDRGSREEASAPAPFEPSMPCDN